MGQVKSKLICIFVGLLFLLCLLEFGLRITGYFYALTLKQASQATENRADGERIISCFGDSSTNGMGDLPGLGGYPGRLGRLLSEHFPEKNYKVINCAKFAYNSSLTLLSVKKYLKHHYPKLIIVFIGTNDHWNYGDVDPKIIDVYKKSLGSRYWIIKLEIFLFNFKTYNLLKICLMNLKSSLNKKIAQQNALIKKDKNDLAVEQFIDLRYDLVQLYEGLGRNKLQPKDFERIKDVPGIVQSKMITELNLSEIVRLAKSKNVKVIIQNYPKHYATSELQEIIRKVAIDYRIPLVDNCLVFDRLVLREGYEKYFIPDGHCNYRGYDIMADNVFKTMVSSGILAEQ